MLTSFLDWLSSGLLSSHPTIYIDKLTCHLQLNMTICKQLPIFYLQSRPLLSASDSYVQLPSQHIFSDSSHASQRSIQKLCSLLLPKTVSTNLSHLSKWYLCSPSWSEQKSECHLWQFSFLHFLSPIHHQILCLLKHPLVLFSIFITFSYLSYQVLPRLGE